MIKFVAVLVLSVSLVQGRPDSPFFSDNILQAAAAGKWDEVQKILTSGGINSSWQAFPTADVKSLKPIPGGQVYGESEYTFHSETNINGQTSEKSAGHKVVNDNGKISEFDFKPVIKPAIKP